MAALLVGLNAASYTRKDKTPDMEIFPNRSSFNPGATGTQAFYSLLSETGRDVVRWQESPAALITAKEKKPAVFVLVGSTRRPFAESEVADLLRWVYDGGRLVLIDREPHDGLAVTTANWTLSLKPPDNADTVMVDPSDQKQMIGETAAIKPGQPGRLMSGVNAIQPSRFFSDIRLDRTADDGTSVTTIESPSQLAPLVHFSSDGAHLMVEAAYGNGEIMLLADPYIVSNGGIALADNAQFAINLVSGNGTIAFDEYHQGFGNDSNRFLQFFAGTPVIAIFLQAGVIVALVFFSQSRRFARPVPEPEPDRLSKLEYISAMAELQNQTQAFDLAVENIYNEFRRRTARHFGLDIYTTGYAEMADLIAARTKLDAAAVRTTLHGCEEIIRGGRTNRAEVIRLIESLRSIEQKLGLSRSVRAKI